MSTNFIPSLLIPEVFHPHKHKENFTADIIEKMMAKNFYKSFEIGDGFKKRERKRILELTEGKDIELTQWLTFLIEENNLDVSSIDESLRIQTVELIKENLYESAELGVSNVALVTGDDPGESLRDEGFKALYESICEIAEAAANYEMNLLIEPLDRFAHKKRIIGKTDDALDLLNRVHKKHSNVGIAFDTAHAALNEEDIFMALNKGGSSIHQIHFSYAVTDATNSLYGDFHMKIGSPGFLNTDIIISILKKIKEYEVQPHDFRVAVEVRGQGEISDCLKNEQELRAILQTALREVASCK